MMMMEKTIRFLDKEKTIWGPIFLLGTLAFGAKSAIPFDLLALAVLGFYLSARWQLRGCYYALALLGIAAALKHAFFTTDHLWQLGIEGSLACSFFITALSFEQGTLFLESLSQQMETRKAALDNLEEELARVRESALSQQIAFQEKIAQLQKEFDELQTDHSSLLILNEVLRKTTARHLQEKETLAINALDHERQIALLKEERDESEKELCRLSSTEALAIQNRELMKELNAARYDKEQTHLINETLARLYARETLKVKEVNEEASALADQLAAARHHVERAERSLHEQLATCRNEIATLTAQLDKANQEAHQGRLALDKLTEVTQRKPVDPHLEEELSFARQKMIHLSQVEPLFLQLKKQFEEKNQVLHQTRSHLFLADTELQRLKMEKASLELNPLPKEVEVEIQELGDHIQRLEEENGQLQELVTFLSKEPQLEKKK